MSRYSLDCEVFKRGKRAADTEKQRQAIKNSELLGFDLLIREMLQNSLDAALNDDPEKTISAYIRLTKLDADAFSDCLGRDSTSGVDYAKRLKDYVRSNNVARKCLSIRDVGCFGMDGDVEDQSSRAWKLPFGFLDGQDSASVAGGANGVGKVVAFKFGIGFVAYYSKTKDGESRFVIAFMDDGVREVFPKSVLPDGSAWWGKRHSRGSSEVFCLEDADEIAELLKIFDLRPYSRGQSGTVVIIPFFDDEAVLNEARSAFPAQICPWVSTFDSYVNFCVKQWYTPRLRNESDDFENPVPYHWGRGLKVSTGKSADETIYEKRVFGLIRMLYDVAVGDVAPKSDVLRIHCPLHRDSNKKGVRFSGDGAGWVAVKKINYLKGDFKGVLPVLCGLAPGGTDEESGIDFTNRLTGRKGFMLYCRRHGMIITYEREWDDVCFGLLPKPQEGEFYVGIFVVDSSSVVKAPSIRTLDHAASIDVMFRSFENTDHYRWPKNSLYEGVPIMAHLLGSIRARLGDEFRPSGATIERHPLDKMSALLGRFISPVGEGFGDGPRMVAEGVGGVPAGLMPGAAKPASIDGPGTKVKPGKPIGTVVRVGRVKFKQGLPRYSYAGGMTTVSVPMNVEFSAKNQSVQIECGVVQDGSSAILMPNAFPVGECPVVMKDAKMLAAMNDCEPPAFEIDAGALTLVLTSLQKGSFDIECRYALRRKDVAIAINCKTRDEQIGGRQ